MRSVARFLFPQKEIVELVEEGPGGDRTVRWLGVRRASTRATVPSTGARAAARCTRNYYLHHTRMITKAAVVRDATMIREQVQCLRQRVCTAHAGAGDVP